MPLRRACALAGIMLAVLAGYGACSSQLDQAHRQAKSRHRAAAVLLTPTGFHTLPGKGGTEVQSNGTTAKIAWTAPDGTRRTGETTAPQNQKAGSHITVWVDASGALTDAPTTTADAVVSAVVAGGLVLSALIVGWQGGRAGRRFWIARRAVVRLDHEWELTAPKWTGRRT